MGMPAARITDMHVCPMITVLVPHVGGPIVTGMFTVLTGSMPQARITDVCVCVGPPDVIVKGSPTVLVGGLMAARIGDLTAHGGVIVTGFPTVLIGEQSSGGGGAGVGGGGSGPVSAVAGKPGEITEGTVGALMASSAGIGGAMYQATALVGAAVTGTPFCARCAAAAAARAGR